MVEDVKLHHSEVVFENGWPDYALESYFIGIPQIVDINVQRTAQSFRIGSSFGSNKDVEICDIQMQSKNFNEHIQPTIFNGYHYTFISTHICLFYPPSDALVIHFLDVGLRYWGEWLGTANSKEASWAVETNTLVEYSQRPAYKPCCRVIMNLV
jgi:hypothetical protein